MDKIHIPPIKIQGIKSKLVPLISQISECDENNIWIEPFMGSGVVGFNISSNNAIFADTNPHIINFYNDIKDGKITSSIARDFLRIEGEKLEKEDDNHYYFIRERFNKEHNSLDFLFLNRSCFNGMIRFNKKYEFNVPYGHKPQRFSKAYITKITNQIKYIEEQLKTHNWVFKCQSFEQTINECPSNGFIYCDPPYIGRHTDYYDNWDEIKEIKLKDTLYKANVNFILSTWDKNKYRTNEYIAKIWKDCYKTTQEHFYHLGAKEENRNSITEALLTNYKPIIDKEGV